MKKLYLFAILAAFISVGSAQAFDELSAVKLIACVVEQKCKPENRKDTDKNLLELGRRANEELGEECEGNTISLEGVHPLVIQMKKTLAEKGVESCLLDW